MSSANRPNIVWLVSEDSNPRIGAYGDPLARTPALDRLAQAGLIFTHAYSTAPVCAPSRFGIITGLYPETAGPAHNMAAEAPVSAYFKGFPQYLRATGYYCSNNAKTHYNSDLDPKVIWNDSSASAHWRARPGGAPFFSVFNFEVTHESRLFEPCKGNVRPEDVSVPPYLPDIPGVRQDLATSYNVMEELDGKISARIEELITDGLTEDTVVFYYSDHGGIQPRGKRFCYEAGLHCPLIISIPERWRHLSPASAGSKIDTPVSWVDLPKTVLSLAGVAPPPHMQGRVFLGQSRDEPRTHAFGMRNRMDERYDMIRTVTDGRYRYIRNYNPHRILGQHLAYAWQAKSYQDWERLYTEHKLNGMQSRFWQIRDFEELYDLVADPSQVRNRIGDRELAKPAVELRGALDAHIMSIRDNGFIPEGHSSEGYVQSRDIAAYPLEKIMAVAATAARRAVENIPYLLQVAEDTNDIVRYWAVQGLLILGAAAKTEWPFLHHLALTDDCPHVRIAAAEAALRLDESDEVLAVLSSILDTHANNRVRLQALNALTYIGDAARQALPAIARAATSDDEYLRGAGRYLRARLDGDYTPSSQIFDTEWFSLYGEHLQRAS